MPAHSGNFKTMEAGSNGRMTGTTLAGDSNLIHLQQRNMFQNLHPTMSGGNVFPIHQDSERATYAQGFYPQKQ